MQVVVDSLLTHYERSGDGKVVVLVHGWGDDVRTFHDLQQLLSEKYDVIAVDLPGFGSTQPPTGVWGLEDYAHFIAAFVHKLSVKDIYAVLGHSNGGAVVIKALATGSLQADKVVLLASAGIRDTGGTKRLALKTLAKLGKPILQLLPNEKRQAVRRRFYGTIGSDLMVAEHLQETFKKTVRQDIQADARKIQQPVLLIWGEHDTAVPLSDGVKLAQLIPNSELKIIHAAGHFVHHDQPVQVASLIGEFLA